MNKAYKTILAVLIMIFGFGFLATGAALADDPPGADELIVNFEDTPLFGNEEGNFMPGDSVTRWVEVTNNTNEERRIATEAINFGVSSSGLVNSNPDDVPSGDLSRVLLIVIREKNAGGGYTNIYGTSDTTGDKTLFQFYKNGETYLSDIVAASGGTGGVNEYEFEVSFPESEGDEWQGATTRFDIIVGFQDEDSEGIITPPSSGGGGMPPGLIIKNEGVVKEGSSSAEIEWWTSYNATSRVIFCKADEDCVLSLADTNKDTEFNLPLYGYNYTTNEENTPANPNGATYRKMELTDLDPETVYEYRCISHASPPTVSRSHTFTTLALVDGEEEPTPSPSQEGNGQEEDGGDDDTGGEISETYQRWVAGASDFIGDALDSFSGEDEDKKDEGEDKKDEDEKDGEVRGAGDEEEDEFYGIEEDTTEGGKESVFSRYWQWPFVLALLLIIFFFWYRRKKKKEEEEIGN